MGLQITRKRLQHAIRKRVGVLLVVVGVVFNSACAPVMMPVSNTDESPVNVSIAIGDTVRVLTKYGDRPTFKVTEIMEESLIGKNRDIRYADMAFVEKRVSGSPEGHVTAVALVIAAGVVFVKEFSKAGFGFPSGI
ncbi:MAG: hypothetical protein O3A13_02755 [Proteobacteria bacterium]|nr:hypothetical protein [Pseudomonadota bacterium]